MVHQSFSQARRASSVCLFVSSAWAFIARSWSLNTVGHDTVLFKEILERLHLKFYTMAQSSKGMPPLWSPEEVFMAHPVDEFTAGRGITLVNES
jgi:hypothetical protein